MSLNEADLSWLHTGIGQRLALRLRHHDARTREATADFMTQLGLQATALTEPPEASDSAFFDPNDLVQVKYEMLRAHVVDGISVVAAADTHGYSRAAFYLVLTHSHDLDLAITEAILRRGDFAYLGLIAGRNIAVFALVAALHRLPELRIMYLALLASTRVIQSQRWQ